MFNNRMLAVAAVLALAVPALGAAAPVVISTKTEEQLVEGHTVFTVIEVNRTTEVNGTTRFAAAVAVLVREYTAEQRNVRFPGVLWFNDQYLVNPQDQEQDNAAYRYPCGGAVMAVNRGDPDPRVLLANGYVQTQAGDQQIAPFGYPDYGNGPGGSTYSNANVTADTTQAGTVNPSDPTDGVNRTRDNTSFYSDGLASALPLAGTFGASYVESYHINDPNDHYWLIDKYQAYYRASAADLDTPVYTYFVWVVNVMGYPTFIPDDGSTNCYPFYDTAFAPVFDIPSDFACNQAGSQPGGLTGRDDPCKGYTEPSRNGNAYCYSGGPVPPGGCGAAPVRLYNALLYFEFEDLTDAGAVKTHSAASTDTNGCHVGTEWACPGNNDDAEGNSHPFHPPVNGHTDSTDSCQATAGSTWQSGNGPTNHGGSGGATPANYMGGGRYGPLPCDSTHATRDIDIYFSGSGRPARPATVLPSMTGDSGSEAPFHDSPRAYYGGTH